MAGELTGWLALQCYQLLQSIRLFIVFVAFVVYKVIKIATRYDMVTATSSFIKEGCDCQQLFYKGLWTAMTCDCQQLLFTARR